MKMLAVSRFGLVAVVSLLMACASGRKESATAAPESDDLLELLTGFGESISKRNYGKAVDYLVPEEKALLMEGGAVPPEKQKALSALPLQKLIRHPAVRVENGKIAGIYTLLPNLRQGEAYSPVAAEETPAEDPSLATAPAEGSDLPMGEEGGEDAMTADSPANDPQLKSTVNKFFAAVNRRNWQGALALMNESERKLLLDDKGRLKESSKQRLSQIDQQNRDALVLQDGKLTGVTLLLPADL